MRVGSDWFAKDRPVNVVINNIFRASMYWPCLKNVYKCIIHGYLLDFKVSSQEIIEKSGNSFIIFYKVQVTSIYDNPSILCMVDFLDKVTSYILTN